MVIIGPGLLVLMLLLFVPAARVFALCLITGTVIGLFCLAAWGPWAALGGGLAGIALVRYLAKDQATTKRRDERAAFREDVARGVAAALEANSAPKAQRDAVAALRSPM